MAINKLIKSAIKDANIEGDPLKDGVATTAKFVGDSVESSEINNNTVVADDLASTLNISSKTVTLPNTSVTAGKLSNTLDLSSKTVTLPTGAVSFDREYNNIALLGFKMAVTESLTVFNLVDGIVDEFHDESGTDESESTNDGGYCASSDFYQNNQAPAPFSAGFSTTAITSPGTSTAGTNPANGSGTFGTFTVPSGNTSINLYAWGAGGGTGECTPSTIGGGGGYTEGALAVTAGQTVHVVVGEGGLSIPMCNPANNSDQPHSLGGGGKYDGGTSYVSLGGAGGGASAIFTSPVSIPQFAPGGSISAPTVTIVGGGGGGNSHAAGLGGAGGGTAGCAGGTNAGAEQTNKHNNSGGGGDQEQGGQGGQAAGCGPSAQTGGFFYGGKADADCSHNGGGSGGSGYYGGGGGVRSGSGQAGAGGGGSSYFGHPQITSGSTEEGAAGEGGGTTSPLYVAGTNEGLSMADRLCTPDPAGGRSEDGYVLISGVQPTGGTSSTTIISNAFTSTTVPTTSRIVVFEENVDTPTLNTDIIASISRDGGSNYTNATLADSGYVTGSSGQRILTGQATISGQPSGQSMRWKLALANNTVKIHGVSLSWA